MSSEQDDTDLDTPLPDAEPQRGDRLTINDIARIANVSKRTISRVINRSPLTKQETREKVLAVIEKFGYVPDPQARGLAFRRSFLIGLVYDNPNAQYMADIQHGILDGIRRSGYALTVYPCHRDEPGFVEDIRGFVEHQKLCGVILPPSASEDEALIAMLNEIGCPYVRIASVSLDIPTSMVVSHDHIGAVEAAHYLGDLGHKLIGHIAGPPTFRSSRERRNGFEQGLAERGLQLDSRYTMQGAYTFDSGVACAKQLLSLTPRPTAIFAGNDEMAAGVYRAAHEAGLDIPDDLSVVGFDDSPIVLKVWPPLTSVLLPVHDMGRIAAQKLLAAVQRGPGAEIEKYYLSPSLVVRQSTAEPSPNA
jgi:LacI family transcriptional regulator